MAYELYKVHNRSGHMTYWGYFDSLAEVKKECGELNQSLIDSGQMGPYTFWYEAVKEEAEHELS